MKKQLSTLFACVLPAMMVFADTAADLNAKWAARREMMENSRRNRQEAMEFLGGIAPGMAGGMAMQQPPAAQLVWILNSALVADMSPVAQRQLAQLAQSIAMQSGGNQMAAVSLLLKVASSLPFSDDNMRIACNCFLTAHVYMGEMPQQVLTQLKAVVLAADSQGQRWHRGGHFGNVLRQLGL